MIFGGALCYVDRVKRFGIAVLFLIAALPGAALAAGDPSRGFQPVQGTGLFAVFGAGTVREGGYVLEPGIEIIKDPDIQRLAFRAGYGVTSNVDVGLNFSLADAEPGNGVEDLSVGGRYRFLDEGRWGPSGAVVLAFSIPIGEDTKGLGSGEFESMGMLALSKRIGPFTGYFNLGYNLVFSKDVDDQVLYAGGLDFRAASRLVLMTEIYGRTSREAGKDSLVEARLGYRATLDPWVTNTVGLGFGLDSAEPEYRIMVLFTFAMPRAEPDLIRVRQP